MKNFYLIYIFVTSLIFAESFIEDFATNENQWYTIRNSKEEVYIEDGNYVLRNLDKQTDLSLSISEDIPEFSVQEFVLKRNGADESIYGLYLELESKERFYLALNSNSIGYLYEKKGDLSLLQEFKEFPYLYKEYNSIIFLKEGNRFTFLINQIPIPEVWNISSSKIKRIGIYMSDSTDLYIDKYTIYKL